MSIVAIVGKTNVGKSTLFNRLVGRRLAIVSDIPGTTRDRVSARVSFGGREFILVDTGGLEPGPETEIQLGVANQVHQAIAEAKVIIFMVDAKEGLTASDLEIADLLRRSGKPVVLVANKVDNIKREADLPDFYRLGLVDPIPISAYHARGLAELMGKVLEHLGPSTLETKDGALKIAIVGRPNVGKSMLLNALLGQERVLVSEDPGTTRDAVDTTLEFEGETVVLIDTAGLRRRGRIEQGIEQYSALRAMEAIYRADVVALVIDAAEPITTHDLHIWGYTKDAFKGVMLVVNKWDLAPALGLRRGHVESLMRSRLRAANYAPILFVSAKERQGIEELVPTAKRIYQERSKEVADSALNRVLARAIASSPMPRGQGRRLKVFSISQTNANPPTFTIYVSDPSRMHFSYTRYLENQIREAFGFEGTPIQLRFRRRNGER